MPAHSKVSIPWAAALCGLAVVLVATWSSGTRHQHATPPDVAEGAAAARPPLDGNSSSNHPTITHNQQPDSARVVLPSLAKLGIPSLPAKARGPLTRLAASEPEERIGALRDLVALQETALGRLFAETLRSDPSPEVRAVAAQVLVESGSEAAPAALVRALGDDEAWVRDNARVAVQELGPELTVEHLRAGLASSNRAFAIECGDLLERVFGFEVPHEFWVKMAGP